MFKNIKNKLLNIIGVFVMASVYLITFGENVSYAESPAFPLTGGHVNQFDISSGLLPFSQVFTDGDKLFETNYNNLDGAGANLAGDSLISIRFSRVPRADLPGFMSDPFRATGPNANSCTACHRDPFQDGSGGIEGNAHRDPQRTRDPRFFIQRNTPPLFGIGALQLLAEEATADLKQIQQKAISQALSCACTISAQLTAGNGVNYGFIVVNSSGSVNTSGVQGVSADLVVRPLQWKGSVTFIRDFTRGAADNEIGMQPVEMVGLNVDNDSDGVANEFSVGDITAMVIYNAAQPRPSTLLELNAKDPRTFPLTLPQKTSIISGASLFLQTGCGSCHKPVLQIKNSIFKEPSSSPDYRDAFFPSGVNPLSLGLDPAFPVTFDLTKDPSIPFSSNGKGGAFAPLFGDLKRHEMGPGLAEAIDEAGTGASVWKTKELWGVGSTGPWLHDGRATTLTEAILLHGGEAQTPRDNFAALSQSSQTDVINFLKNLVLFKK